MVSAALTLTSHPRNDIIIRKLSAMMKKVGIDKPIQGKVAVIESDPGRTIPKFTSELIG